MPWGTCTRAHACDAAPAHQTLRVHCKAHCQPVQVNSGCVALPHSDVLQAVLNRILLDGDCSAWEAVPDLEDSREVSSLATAPCSCG